MANVLYVSIDGSDDAAGTHDAPLRTIDRAAQLARPGDTVTVHAGTYREWVRPRRGGTGEHRRITYQAAPGEHVRITGAEQVTGWQPLGGGVWRVEIPNALFGDLNPFAVEIDGDWIVRPGRDDPKQHLGAVYLDGRRLHEVATADAVATALLRWAEDAGGALARARGLDRTQLDSGAFDADPRQQRWLAAAGYTHVRTWWQMRRPVGDDDRGLRPTGPGVVVRRLERGTDGMPDARDLVAAHDLLERAFVDHFNHHEETFDEFLARLRADPGHRWDHWWLAELVDGDAPEPVGVLLAGESTDAAGRATGSYVEYLGVAQAARGRGVARSLVDAVVTDAAERGRGHVGLEVDADSPTGAADLYVSLGFATRYVTQSWHRYVDTD